MQALIVGQGQKRQNFQDDDSHPASLYSVDPSGGWRSWGGHATAIGKHAESTRRALWEKLGEHEKDLDIQEALEIALEALLFPSKQSNSNMSAEDLQALKEETNVENIDAVVLLLGSHNKCVAIEPAVLEHILYTKCFPSLHP